MENSESQSDHAQADKSKSETGVIPKEEIKGSDADSAYNQDQEFADLKSAESEQLKKRDSQKPDASEC